MTDLEFFAAMHKGLPPIEPPAGLSTVDCGELLLGNTDIEVNHPEATGAARAEVSP